MTNRVWVWAVSATCAALVTGCDRDERSRQSADPLAPSVQQVPASGGFSAQGERGMLRFELVFEPDPPGLGELFRVITTIRDARTGEPVEGALYTLDATMPEHGHGMMTRPRHRPVGGGRYVSEGMKLHMPGLWHLRVEAKEPKDGGGPKFGEDGATWVYERPAGG
jgi:hypothetical protein